MPIPIDTHPYEGLPIQMDLPGRSNISGVDPLVKLHHSTARGGVLVSHAGRLIHFDAKGNSLEIPWTVAVSNPEDIGLLHNDLVENTPLEPLQQRELQFGWPGDYIAVEDGPPYGRGMLLCLNAQ